jgi:hypothetical protein
VSEATIRRALGLLQTWALLDGSPPNQDAAVDPCPIETRRQKLLSWLQT